MDLKAVLVLKEGCSICQRAADRERYRSYYSRRARTKEEERQRSKRRKLWLRYQEHPEELKLVRWDPRLPNGEPAPEYGGLVWGSFSSASGVKQGLDQFL